MEALLSVADLSSKSSTLNIGTGAMKVAENCNSRKVETDPCVECVVWADDVWMGFKWQIFGKFSGALLLAPLQTCWILSLTL